MQNLKIMTCLYWLFFPLSVVDVAQLQEGEYPRLTHNPEKSSDSVSTSEVVEAVAVHEGPVTCGAVRVVSHYIHLATLIIRE